MLFWWGVLFGASVTLLLILVGITVYVQLRGAFVIGPPERTP